MIYMEGQLDEDNKYINGVLFDDERNGGDGSLMFSKFLKLDMEFNPTKFKYLESSKKGKILKLGRDNKIVYSN